MTDIEAILGKLKNIVIVTGHFGSGKTNFSVNLAIQAANSGRKVTLVDMDIVNPYFRAADNREELEAYGVKCIVPEFANTNVDIPTLPAEIFSVFSEYGNGSDMLTVFDVGGDNGAVALGMYRQFFNEYGYSMLCVLNKYRPLTEEIEDCLSDIAEIEGCSALRVTGLVNNSNLGAATLPEDVISSVGWADEISQRSGIPVICTSVILPDAQLPDKFVIENKTKQLF